MGEVVKYDFLGTGDWVTFFRSRELYLPMKLLGGPVRNAITVVPRKVHTCILTFVVVEQGPIRYGLFHRRVNYTVL